jgi:hypothetical protein
MIVGVLSSPRLFSKTVQVSRLASVDRVKYEHTQKTKKRLPINCPLKYAENTLRLKTRKTYARKFSVNLEIV